MAMKKKTTANKRELDFHYYHGWLLSNLLRKCRALGTPENMSLALLEHDKGQWGQYVFGTGKKSSKFIVAINSSPKPTLAPPTRKWTFAIRDNPANVIRGGGVYVVLLCLDPDTHEVDTACILEPELATNFDTKGPNLRITVEYPAGGRKNMIQVHGGVPVRSNSFGKLLR